MARLVFFVTQTALYAALSKGANTIERTYTMATGETQSMMLVPFLGKVLDDADRPSLTSLVVPRGPGSFSTLRVTLATAHALSFVYPDAQVCGPTLFDVLLTAAPDAEYAVIDSHRGDYFVKQRQASEPLILSKDAFVAFQHGQGKGFFIVEPDLKTYFSEKDDSGSVQYETECLLHTLCGMHFTHSMNTFSPYYLFDPTYKKCHDSPSNVT
jgi:tRNA A37 threonylcarbamoyladenosine modification protein TsaB